MDTSDLSLEDKAALTAGYDSWTVPGIESLGVPSLRMTDGPNGARGAGSFSGDGVRAICVPNGSALAATFDPDLVERIGKLLGREARQKRARVLLAPTINMVRSPLYGRSFECYGEDPWLSGKLAAAFVTGVQSEGVATTPKHLVGNEAEYQRTTINSVIDERTLREVYLLPFEFAIRHGGSLGVMTSYNRVNGRYCSEDAELLNGILRDEWGFEGFVVSDWYAAGSTVGALEGGLDVQMPGPDRFYGAPVAKAIANGQVDGSHLDAIVQRRIHVHTKLDAWDVDATEPELGVEHDDDRLLAHQAATESMVLLQNDGLLPLDPNTGTVALIGPNAMTAHIMGGGSAQLPAHRRVPPKAVFEERLGDRVSVHQGCVIDKNLRPLRPDSAFEVEFFRGEDWAGPAVATESQRLGAFVHMGAISGVGTEAFTARMTGTFTPAVGGEHLFSLVQLGPTRVIVDGTVVLDGITERPAKGEAFFGLGSVEVRGAVKLTAGTPVEVSIEFTGHAGSGIRGVRVGHQAPIPTDLVEQAAVAAAQADVAVVVVGTSHEWETEGHDRDTLDLPGEQVELIRAVCVANPRTCVVVNAGSAVDMSWSDEPAAVLYGWLGGQEMAPALFQVLFGEAEPGGRLPITLPLAIEHTPAFGTFPGESNDTRYAEGTLVGHRWFDTRKLAVAFPFGHGLSYSSFDWSTPTVKRTGDARCQVELTVTNTGSRSASDVVQVYVGPPPSNFTRPSKQLVATAKARLEPGESTTLSISLSERSFAIWDPANQDHIVAHERLAGSGTGVPLGGGSSDASEAGWYVEPGEYTINLARSVSDVAFAEAFEVTALLGPLTGEASLP